MEALSKNPESMYTGHIARTIVEDVQAKGGIITLEDTKNYKVTERIPISTEIGENTLYTLPPPNGGPVLMHIININEGR